MTTVNYTVANVNNDDSIQLVTWTLAQGQTGTAYAFSQWADRSIQISGTFGGATVATKGSNDNATFLALHDAFGNAMTATAANALIQITELSAYVQPVVTGGDGTTSLTVTLCARRPQPLFRQSH
jgi:hypothetical protein